MKTNCIYQFWLWLCAHHGWAHYIGGLVCYLCGLLLGCLMVGLSAGMIAGISATMAAAFTSEVKDCQWGGSGTIIDLLVTTTGGLTGFIITVILL